MRDEASAHGLSACAEALEPRRRAMPPERTACPSDVSEPAPLVRLFNHHHPRLFRLARRLSSSHDEARDLVQDTFVRVLRCPAALPEDSQGQESWLVTTLLNLARDRARRRTLRHRVAAASSAAPADDRTGPERAYLARLAVQEALDRLNARRRAVVVLHYIEGEPVARVAALLRLSPITVRWHLARARRELAALLSGGGLSV